MSEGHANIRRKNSGCTGARERRSQITNVAGAYIELSFVYIHRCFDPVNIPTSVY